MTDINVDGVVEDASKYLGDVKDWLDDNPEAAGVVLIALQRLQGLIKQAGLPEVPDKPVGADAIREMARGAISNLKESQSTLEKFIHASLETSEHLVDALEMLVHALTD